MQGGCWCGNRRGSTRGGGNIERRTGFLVEDEGEVNCGNGDNVWRIYKTDLGAIGIVNDEPG
jgi:hypothetical protein